MPEAVSSVMEGNIADPSLDASGNKRKRVSRKILVGPFSRCPTFSKGHLHSFCLFPATASI